MDIIPIQASSVPCERVFSAGKETMTPCQSRILEQLMESLQILKFSIWKGRPISFTQGMLWTDELKNFEYAARVAPLGDDDAYGRSLDIIDEEDHNDLEDILNDLGNLKENLIETLMDGSNDDDGGSGGSDVPADDLSYI
jgi:hypothetical protein